MNTFRIFFRFRDNVQGSPTYNTIVTRNIDIGLIQSINNTYGISNTTVGIPSQPSQNAFAMDSGVQRTYKFNFRRVAPQNPVDDLNEPCTSWSNGFWVYVMKKYIVNRWQSETDGCKISYTSDDEQMYPSIDLVNVYVSTFTPEMTAGDNMTLKGDISFIVGATNLSKNVAKHIITYDANYTYYDSNAVDDTNYVTITDDDRMIPISIPTSWVARAENVYGLPTVSDSKKRWCTMSDPSSTGAELYKEDDTIDLREIGDLTLYAIYDYEES